MVLERSDGRDCWKTRRTIINVGSIGTAYGSALVRRGKTTIVCGVKGELANSRPENPGDGFLVVNLDLPPLCCPLFKPGPPSEQSQSISQFLNDIVTSSGCVVLSDLSIEGQLVWCLFVDIICLEYDGNVIDAAVLAMLAALTNTKLPKITVSNDNGEIKVSEALEILAVKSQPVTTTFVYQQDGGHVMVDPSFEEEYDAAGILSITLQEDGSLVKLYKPGGLQLPDSVLEQCIAKARSLSKDMWHLLKTVSETVET
ncbi:exosome complex component RRP43-like [Limulus polyphemus]|uniref:Ribosomal RNA-processing protein 43 n=1 Tax=Limulus polyphemus TaxID=6850 RepID=A0ABM1C1I2_LIMPO|nr:exosome complex component RRP43-like [Limulus polyphemus]XP_022236055.1 exosome complex component RRP43-like [Limulus polyphemus]